MPIIALLIYLFLCFCVATAASSEGRSFKLWFIASIVIDPIAAYVIYRLVK